MMSVPLQVGQKQNKVKCENTLVEHHFYPGTINVFEGPTFGRTEFAHVCPTVVLMN